MLSIYKDSVSIYILVDFTQKILQEKTVSHRYNVYDKVKRINNRKWYF